jgi:hypothetical protein
MREAIEDPADMAFVFARLFRGADGERALAWLRGRTIERRLSPEASEASLRWLEGQRFLVATIEALARRGRDGNPQ